MMKINQWVLLALLGLSRGLTAAIFAVLGFYPVIVDKVSRKYLYRPDCGKLKKWAIVGLLRILGITTLPLTALLIKGLNYMNHRILTVIHKRYTGGKI